MPGNAAMDCQDVRLHLLDYQRGSLDPARQQDVRTHLGGCAACTRVEAVEQTLTELLERRLPVHPASLALKRRLAAAWPAPVRTPRPWRRGLWGWQLAPGLAVAAALLVALPLLYYERATVGRADGTAGMVTEALNDHLRLLQSERPLGRATASATTVRGFTVVLWRSGDLGYAIVSDVDPADLLDLAARIVGG